MEIRISLNKDHLSFASIYKLSVGIKLPDELTDNPDSIELSIKFNVKAMFRYSLIINKITNKDNLYGYRRQNGSRKSK
jgi:hypothetical protein